MMIDILDLPQTKKILEAAEHKIFSNTGIKVKLIMQSKNVEHDLNYRKSVLKKIVTAEFIVTWEDILSTSRQRRIVAARHCYMYCLRNFFLENLKEIGQQLNRDHTSIIHAMAVINGYYDVGDSLVTKIENVKKQYNDVFLQNEN
jgi:chromosomal replication initiation ATPase DnaA